MLVGGFPCSFVGGLFWGFVGGMIDDGGERGRLAVLMSSCLLERLCHGAVVSKGFGVGRPGLAVDVTAWSSSCWSARHRDTDDCDIGCAVPFVVRVYKSG